MGETKGKNEGKITILAQHLDELSVGISKIQNGILHTAQVLMERFIEVVSSEFMQGFKNVLSEIGKDILEASKNPNSVFNYSKYEKRLNEVHWAWPYEIEAETLFDILQNVNSEKDFDDAMLKLFTDDKIVNMLGEAKNGVARHHRVLLSQVERGIKGKNYALVNNALLSVIDNSLSVYIRDKGMVKRKGIFQPIIEHFEDYSLDEISEFIFELCMLSNNINYLFDNVDFTKKIQINTNKKARRHAALHGFKYSNKKIDTIMLLNTLVALVKIRPYLRMFENNLEFNRKKQHFKFADDIEERFLQNRVEDTICVMIELNGKITHASAVEYIEKTDYCQNIRGDKRRYISKVLQKMKRKGIIDYVKDDGERYWKYV